MSTAAPSLVTLTMSPAIDVSTSVPRVVPIRKFREAAHFYHDVQKRQTGSIGHRFRLNRLADHADFSLANAHDGLNNDGHNRLADKALQALLQVRRDLSRRFTGSLHVLK